MIFLRSLFWAVFAVVVAAFSANNWQRVTLRLWSDVLVDINLPALLVIVFLAGLLPGVILHRVGRWRLRRQLRGGGAAAYQSSPVADPMPGNFLDAS